MPSPLGGVCAPLLAALGQGQEDREQQGCASGSECGLGASLFLCSPKDISKPAVPSDPCLQEETQLCPDPFHPCAFDPMRLLQQVLFTLFWDLTVLFVCFANCFIF